MMGFGTFLGANIPTQLDASMSGTPSSCSVFHAGLKLDRFEVVTASTRTRSDWRNGSTEEIARSPSGYVAGCNRCRGRCAASVGNMEQLDARLEPQLLDGDMIERASSGRRDTKRFRFSSRSHNNVRDRMIGRVAIGR